MKTSANSSQLRIIVGNVDMSTLIYCFFSKYLMIVHLNHVIRFTFSQCQGYKT